MNNSNENILYSIYMDLKENPLFKNLSIRNYNQWLLISIDVNENDSLRWRINIEDGSIVIFDNANAVVKNFDLADPKVLEEVKSFLYQLLKIKMVFDDFGQYLPCNE